MGILHRNVVGRIYVRELPKVTVDQFWEWGPCWPKEDIEPVLDRYKRERWSALEVLALDEVEPGDRLWVVMREPMLPVDVLVRIARETAAVAMNLSGWSDDRSWLAVEEPSSSTAANAANATYAARAAAYAARANAYAANATYAANAAANAAKAAANAAYYAAEAACAHAAVNAAYYAARAARAAAVCRVATQTVLRYVAGHDMGGPLWTKRTAL